MGETIRVWPTVRRKGRVQAASKKPRRRRECLVERCQNINVMRSTRNKLLLPVFVSLPILCVVRSFRNPRRQEQSAEQGTRTKPRVTLRIYRNAHAAEPDSVDERGERNGRFDISNAPD